MEMKGNTILITGGTSGIGLALAKRFLTHGNTVIVCGRTQSKLEEAKRLLPDLQTYLYDISLPEDRVALYQKVTADFPNLNIVFNNAGIMNFLKLDDPAAWPRFYQEIATNLEAPIHLSLLFAAHLSSQRNPVILNTTSGLSHVPLVAAPVYSATKAGLHSFTMSLRTQLADKGIQVIEISPPHVNTDLGAPGANEAGMPLDDFAEAVMAGLSRGDLEITYGFSSQSRDASAQERELLFQQLNQPSLVGAAS